MAIQKWEYGTATASRNVAGTLIVNGTMGKVPPFTNAAPQNHLATYLETAGNEGWELTATVGDTHHVTLFFKRPQQ